ncbi:MAG: hypothetical protein FWC79_03135 [Oscillospiraceae bacterium]|nr:hypothetical protein [Oscillospiraceae bacterium]
MHGRCLVTACKRGDFDIITVVLGSDTKRIRGADSIKLIEYAFANYEHIDIGEIAKEEFEQWKQAYSHEIFVDKGIEDYILVNLATQKYSIFPINKEDIDNIRIEITSVEHLEAPVFENQVVRHVRYSNK